MPWGTFFGDKIAAEMGSYMFEMPHMDGMKAAEKIMMMDRMQSLTVDEMVEMVRLGGWQTMAIDAGLQAGTDLWLNTDSDVYKMGDVFDNATLVTALRNASHDILYTVVNSSAMNGIDENVVVKKVLPLWQYWLIAFDIVIAVIIIDGVVLVVRRCKKNNGIEIVAEENK